MRYTLKSIPLAEADQLPFRLVLERQLPASPERVFEVLAEPSTWPHWFNKMTKATWVSGEGGLGSTRIVHIQDVFEQKYLERIVGWEPGRRFAFATEATNVPLAKAILEDFKLSPSEGGCRITWTLNYDPVWFARLLHPILRLAFGKMLGEACDGLERYLRAG